MYVYVLGIHVHIDAQAKTDGYSLLGPAVLKHTLTKCGNAHL